MSRPITSNGNNTAGVTRLYVFDWELVQVKQLTDGFIWAYKNDVFPDYDVRVQVSDLLIGNRDTWVEELLPINTPCSLSSNSIYGDKGSFYEHKIAFSLIAASDADKAQLSRLQRNGFIAFAILPDGSSRGLGDDLNQCRLTFSDDSGDAPGSGSKKTKVEITNSSKSMPYYVWNGVS
jgi:hypothetical protein